MLVLELITYLFYNLVKTNKQKEYETEFSLKTQKIQTLLEERMLAYEHVLYGTKGLFLASDSVTRNEFRSYVASLSIDQYFPGIQGVGYSAVIPTDKKKSFLNQIRSKGLTTYTITPVAPSGFRTSIVYLEPFDARNRRTFGRDMYANEIRHKAMSQARDTNKPAISGKVTLLQEYKKNIQAGFLMYLPLFKKGTDNDTVEQRRKHILGWVYAPFRINDFMSGLKGYEANDFDLEIYDNGMIDDEHLLFDSDKQKHLALYKKTINLNVAGRNWTLFIKSTSEFEKKLDISNANLILMLGTLLSIVLVYIIYELLIDSEHNDMRAKNINKELLENRNKLFELNENLEKRVEVKTHELQHSNEVLERNVATLNILNFQLTKAKEQALQAAQARSNFISSISHELRTPLNAIINFTDQTIEDFDEMLYDKELQADTKGFLNRVIVNSKHLLGLINDLLEFTKAEAGKMEYKMQKCDINETLRIAYNNTYSLLNATDVKYELELCKTPLSALVDSRRLLQVVLNLISNAIKFTKQGSISLTTFKEGEQNIIEISDTGKGIPLEKQKIIFEPFMQVNSSDTGTGLGLGLAKRMCDDMGISISFVSVENEGTKFRLAIKTQMI